MFALRFSAALAFVFTATGGVCAQTTWWVDVNGPAHGNGSAAEPFRRIQSAIDVATHSDVVRVQPGTYNEKLDFVMKTIRVESVAGAGATTIRANEIGSVVRLRGGTPVLSGFTVENGSGTPSPYDTFGGGILFDHTANARVENCVIRNNYADKGDGIAGLDAHGVIANCTIEQNGGSQYPGWCMTIDDGGGVYGTLDLLVDSCLIQNNKATLAGGGVYGCSVANCLVQNNYASEGAGLSRCSAVATLIQHNTADSCDGSYAAAGGADRSTLEYCQLIDNYAWDLAGGASDSTLRHCLVQGNLALGAVEGYETLGGGTANCIAEDCWYEGNDIRGTSHGLPPGEGGGAYGGRALRCVFVDNTADYGAGTANCDLDRCLVIGNQGEGVAASAWVSCSIVRGNLGSEIVDSGYVAWTNVEGGWPGTGNIDADPRFWNPAAKDFRLAGDSPCIDSGDPLRTDPDGSRMDMGPFPYDPTHCPTAFVYCVPKTNSCGGQPLITFSGSMHAGATSGFVISTSGARSGKGGLLLYSPNGSANTPFQGGTLCVAAQGMARGLQVTSAGGSGGLACDANFSIDWAEFSSGNLGGGPQPFLNAIGQRVNVQWWGRDNQVVGCLLSAAIQYAVCP